jgi:Tol biopolymer transport system component
VVQTLKEMRSMRHHDARLASSGASHRYPLLLVVMLGLVLAARPAAATFPGANGRLVLRGGGGTIVTINPDGSGRTVFTPEFLTIGTVWDPSWSPDGRRLAVTSQEQDFEAIWIVNSDGTGGTRVSSRQAGEAVLDFDPAWSPDGRRIAFRRSRRVNNVVRHDIFVVNADGTGQHMLTAAPVVDGDRSLDWSPAGDTIAFEREGDIWVMNADGTGQVNLTLDDRNRDQNPSWAPDGSRIAWSRHDFEGAIWMMAPNGSGKLEVRPPCAGCELWDVAWSPDGHEIAFIQDRPADSAQEEVWVIGRDGSGESFVTDAFVGTEFGWGVRPLAVCGNGVVESGEQCDVGGESGTSGTCCTAGCTLRGAGEQCRAVAGPCDVAETCSGTSPACPDNRLVAAGTACTDGNLCTQADTCQAGVCVGNPSTCTASDQCHTAGTCNPLTGLCSDPAVPDGTPCNNGSNCVNESLLDSCQRGVCEDAPACPRPQMPPEQVNRVTVTCAGDGPDDICEAQAFAEPTAEIKSRHGVLTAAAAAQTGEVSITRKVRKRVRAQTGDVKLKLKLNAIGKKLLREADKKRESLPARVKLTRRNGEEVKSVLNYLILLVKRR